MKVDAKQVAGWAKVVAEMRSEGKSDKYINRIMRGDGIPMSIRELDEHASTWANVFRTMGQGLTFGFGDEITAGIRAMGGEDYDQAVADERQQIKNYSNVNPGKALGLEVAGSLPTMFIPGLGQARGATTLGRLGKAALQGSVEGSIYGAGVGEGSLENRAKSAAQGGAGGAVGGVAMRGAGEIFGPQLSKAWARMIGTSADEQMAKGIVRDTARYDGGSQAVQQRASQVTPTRQGEAVLGDMGENLQSTTQAAANLSGDVMTAVKPIMRGREARASGRVADSVRRGINTTKKFARFMADEVADITAAQKGKTGPAYKAAYAEMDLSEFAGDLNTLAKHPLIKKAATQAKYFVDPGEKFNLANTDSARTWDLIKRGLGKVYEDNTDQFGKSNALAGQSAKMSERLLKILDDELVDPKGLYSAARQFHAGPAKIKSALDKGFKLFNTLDSNKIGYGLQDVQKMTQSELEGFVRGVGYATKDMLEKGADSATAMRRLVKGPRRDILRAAFPDDEAFGKFVRELDDELTMFETSASLLRGSRTEPLKRAMDALAKRAGGGVQMNAEGLLSSLVGKIRNEGVEVSKDNVMKHLGKMLMTPTSDTKAISKILDGSTTDKIYDAVRAVSAAATEKMGRRLGAKATTSMGLLF